uniref:Uncharacterized protein n=1 Tax=Setaria italica TaxID=4555 RepID=K3ZGI9_SETIT
MVLQKPSFDRVKLSLLLLFLQKAVNYHQQFACCNFFGQHKRPTVLLADSIGFC